MAGVADGVIVEQPAAEAAAPEQQALQPRAAMGGFGLIPTTWEAAWRCANAMASSSFVPNDFKQRPDNIMVAMQLGAEVGLAPMQALQSIAVINGRPGIFGDGLLALVMSKPAYQTHDEYFMVGGERRDFLVTADLMADDTCAIAKYWRKGRQAPVTQTFSIGQAKKAQLWGKAGPWTNYPARMLQMRARSWAIRDLFPDVLRGISMVEELQDIVIEASEPAAAAVDQAQPLGPVQRKSAADKKKAAPAADPVSTSAASSVSNEATPAPVPTPTPAPAAPATAAVPVKAEPVAAAAEPVAAPVAAPPPAAPAPAPAVTAAAPAATPAPAAAAAPALAIASRHTGIVGDLRERDGGAVIYLDTGAPGGAYTKGGTYDAALIARAKQFGTDAVRVELCLAAPAQAGYLAQIVSLEPVQA